MEPASRVVIEGGVAPGLHDDAPWPRDAGDRAPDLSSSRNSSSREAIGVARSTVSSSLFESSPYSSPTAPGASSGAGLLP
eukprot:4644415-Prymnesium_polylepis.2